MYEPKPSDSVKNYGVNREKLIQIGWCGGELWPKMYN